jgi:hypothetical protein
MKNCSQAITDDERKVIIPSLLHVHLYIASEARGDVQKRAGQDYEGALTDCPRQS